jgi:N-acetylglutamate synthase-like GNAT family acetyltransferase
MKDQSTADDETLRVRRLEARDLQNAGEKFPGAMVHIHAGPADSMHSFFEGVASRRQNAWVAEADGRLIGMAVVSIENQTLARLMYLHVADDSVNHERAAKSLAAIAIREAWEEGYLKLVVHTKIPANNVIDYMHELGFEFGRTQSSGSQRIIEFYRNLYQIPQEPFPEIGDVQ